MQPAWEGGVEARGEGQVLEGHAEGERVREGGAHRAEVVRAAQVVHLQERAKSTVKGNPRTTSCFKYTFFILSFFNDYFRGSTHFFIFYDYLRVFSLSSIIYLKGNF